MGRPKLPKSEKKVQLGITISKEISDKIDKITHNKSKFIEHAVQAYFDTSERIKTSE